jgi:hypothetical protein
MSKITCDQEIMDKVSHNCNEIPLDSECENLSHTLLEVYSLSLLYRISLASTFIITFEE